MVAVVRRRFGDKPVERDFLAWTWLDDEVCIDNLIVYTDGAAELSAGWPRTPVTAGWGAVLFATGPGGELGLLGVCFAPVVVDPGAPGFWGAERPTAPVSEMLAVAVVLHMARRAFPELGFCWAFHVDATYVLDLLQLKARASSNTKLVHAAREEAEYAATYGELDLKHVSGHAGVAANELADILAVEARRGGSTSPVVAWGAPMEIPVWRGRGAGDEGEFEKRFWADVVAMASPACGLGEAPPDEKDTLITARFLTANVLTLRPATDSSEVASTRRLDLERQFHLADVAVAGLQETRARESGVRDGLHFRMLAAAASSAGVGSMTSHLCVGMPVRWKPSKPPKVGKSLKSKTLR